MHDLKPPQESFYINPEIFSSSSGTDLEAALERAALDKRLLWRGGHWLWGVRTFEHDPTLPYPHVLPVIAGKTWRVDVDAKANPLSIDPPIAGRWRSSVESILRRLYPPAVTEDGYARPEALILECLEGLRPDAAQQQAKFESDLQSRRLTLDNWDTPWKGRDLACPVFGCFDDPGYDLLVRVAGVFGKLCLGSLTKAQAVGHVEPKTHDREVVEIDSDWFKDHVRLDFHRGRLEVAVADGERRWQLMFSDVAIWNAAYGGSPAPMLGVEEPAVEMADLPTRKEALHLLDGAVKRLQKDVADDRAAAESTNRRETPPLSDGRNSDILRKILGEIEQLRAEGQSIGDRNREVLNGVAAQLEELPEGRLDIREAFGSVQIMAKQLEQVLSTVAESVERERQAGQNTGDLAARIDSLLQEISSLRPGRPVPPKGKLNGEQMLDRGLDWLELNHRSKLLDEQNWKPAAVIELMKEQCPCFDETKLKPGSLRSRMSEKLKLRRSEIAGGS